MADHSKIEWTNATWNPVTGCFIRSAGCTNCYAMALAGGRLRHHPSRAGLTAESARGPVWTGAARLNEAWLDQPQRWKRPRDIFVVAHGDLFYEAVPTAWIDAVFESMAQAPWHRYQILTKRPERAAAYLAKAEGHVRDAIKYAPHASEFQWPPRNWLIGFSAEDQGTFNQRWAAIAPLAREGWRLWCSLEPLLGPVTVFDLDGPIDVPHGDQSPLEWVVVGGESGARARPMHPQWVRDLRDQCAGVAVGFFFKQWGEFGPYDRGRTDFIVLSNPGALDLPMQRPGKKAAGRLLDGRTHDDMPRAD